jgi:hypothetical protein
MESAGCCEPLRQFSQQTRVVMAGHGAAMSFGLRRARDLISGISRRRRLQRDGDRLPEQSYSKVQ